MDEIVNPKATQESTYVLDAESELELSRLLVNDQLVTRDLGGIWPEIKDSGAIQFVLDMACGPGGWLIEVARTNPHMDVMGVDISPAMVRYARAQAQARGLDNTDFAVMDITRTMPIPDHSFDLINGRYLVGVLARTQWPLFLSECLRLLRPGGIMRLTELETPITNSAACDELNHLITLAMYRAGYGFSARGYQFGIQMELEPMLRAAGFERTGLCASITNASAGTPTQILSAQNLSVVYYQVKPFIQKFIDMPADNVAELIQRACRDMYAEHFHSVQTYVTAWGYKACLDA